MLPCPPSQEDNPEDMGRGPSQEGIEARQRILAELARRWREFESPPSWLGLAADLEMPIGTLRFHVGALQKQGLMHPTGLWITRAGYRVAHPN